VHGYVTALEQWRDARVDSTGSRKDLRKVRTAHQRQRAARDGALKLLTVEDFERRMQVWVERLEAAERHGNRLDQIGASSVKRGTSRGQAGAEDPAVVPVTATPEARGLERLARESARDAAPQDAGARSAASAETAAAPGTAPAAEARPATAPAAALAPAAPAVAAAPVAGPTSAALGEDEPYAPATAFEELPDFAARLKEALDGRQPAPWDAPAEPVSSGDAAVVEPPAVTGHTRRVELFDLAQRGTAAGRAAAADGPSTDAGEPTDAEGAEVDPVVVRDRRIVELARDGLTQREIAEQLSVSRAAVGRVVRRWKDQGSPSTEPELAHA
jgi:hypothetical protein